MAHREDFKFLELMQLDHFNSSEDKNLMSIEELNALLRHKKKVENNRKSRKYISDINLRFRIMSDTKSKKFFNNMNPFRKAA